MNQQYFEKLSEMVKKAQQPLHEIAELNMKAMQNVTYLKPEELAHVKKPEELLEKQLELAVENGHKALDYMQKYFQIMEKTMVSLIEDVKKKASTDKK